MRKGGKSKVGGIKDPRVIPNINVIPITHLPSEPFRKKVSASQYGLPRPRAITFKFG